jgi:hypothetical protein
LRLALGDDDAAEVLLLDRNRGHIEAGIDPPNWSHIQQSTIQASGGISTLAGM